MWPVYDGPRPPKLATDLYTRARQQFMRRTAACDGSDQHASEFCQAVDNGGIDGYLDPRLLRGPVHSLRRVAHQMNGPFRAYGVQPFPSLAAVEQKTRATVNGMFNSGDPMEQDLKLWMSRKGISLAQRSPGLPAKRVAKAKQIPYVRGTVISGDVLGPRGMRRLLSPPAASPEYLKRELQMDGMHMPRAMTSKIGMKECSRSQFRSMKVRVSEQFKEIYNPVRDETVSLSQMSGLTKLQIEEMRRRWWRESPGGKNDLSAFVRLMKVCRACAGFKGDHQDCVRETLSDMFEFLDVDNDNKIDFEEFIRACGVFVLASEPLEPLLLSNYSHVDHLSKGQVDFLENPRKPGDRMSKRDLQRTNMRVQLAKLFYGDMALDRDLKRCVAVQVSRMMTVLLGDREFKSHEDRSKKEK